MHFFLTFINTLVLSLCKITLYSVVSCRKQACRGPVSRCKNLPKKRFFTGNCRYLKKSL